MVSIEEQIQLTIDKLRPFIRRDGGDVEFVAFEDGIVYINIKPLRKSSFHEVKSMLYLR